MTTRRPTGRVAAQCASLLVALCASTSSRAAASPEPGVARLTIRAEGARPTISRHIYGHFAEHLGHCIYGGIWVGEESDIPNTRGIRRDVVAALREIRIPVLRWPGGCFADEYHWKDGIGPRAERPTMINTHWGGVTENNHFGTHEFLDLCEQLECEPYICGNVGSGSVKEMQDWVEYITFDGVSPMADLRRRNGREKPWKLRYFGVGNENWGCGGNMRPEYYADLYRRYQTYVRSYSGNRVLKIACGPYGDNYHWTEVLMREARGRMWGLAPHYYCGTGEKSRSATEFAEVDWIAQLERAIRIDALLVEHETVMDRLDPDRRVAIVFDEWGAWHAVEPGTNPRFLYQQNSLRDALVAGLTLNIFNNHAERVKMANIAQTVNVLQAMLLTRGPRMVRTPTYWVYWLYRAHHDARLLATTLVSPDYSLEGRSIPAVNVSASRAESGEVHVSLCNTDPHRAVRVKTALEGIEVRALSGQVLTASRMQEHNTFEEPDRVRPAPLRAVERTAGGFEATLPPMSVSLIEIE